jgi:hypothetical protein
MADSNVFMLAFGSFDEPLKQGNYLNTTDEINRATKLVIHSFFEHGFKNRFGDMNDTIVLRQQFEERWKQFYKCIISGKRNMKNQTAVWETLYFCVMYNMGHMDLTKSNENNIEEEKVADIACIILEFIRNLDFNISSNGISPLLFSIQHNLNEYITSLLRHSGAQFSVGEGSVAMTTIVKASYYFISCITQGKTKLECLNSRIITPNGGTALHYVCSTENNTRVMLNKINLLLHSGVNPLVLNDDLLSPRDILEKRFRGMKYEVNSDIDKSTSYLCDFETSNKENPSDIWQETVRMLIKKNGISDTVTFHIMQQLYVAQPTRKQQLF